MQAGIKDWNTIKSFLAVCDTGSLVQGAQQLELSHATVFRHVAALEDNMGTRLFDRIKGRYVLTEAGIELRELSLGIMQFFDAINRRVAGQDDSISGTVRLTAPRSFSDSVLPRYLLEFNRLYPDVAVELLVSNQAMDLSDRSAEIALRVAQEPPDYLWGRCILHIQWALYASKAYLQNNGALTDYQQLPQHKLIAPAGRLLQHPVFSAMLKEQQAFTGIRSDDLTSMFSLAKEGVGVALLPDDLQSKELVRCCSYPKAPANSLWLLAHPDLRGVNRVAVLMRFLANAFAEDSYWHQ